ncbi:hypothetical protein [Nodularia sp. UHCC 0506]|uniref:hypothetical protein n=1 Tax=Nodularia sp. UHCC 0506 TaxID=3110243 RepID=UPI002B20D34B|nr:hypothetical protein [Nodularia sp. UHCC 0506]MEA5515230.1 hypothetical protein [Nodularia sp. UHCC 0506]
MAPALAVNLDTKSCQEQLASNIKSLLNSQLTIEACQRGAIELINAKLPQFESASIERSSSNLTPPESVISQSNPEDNSPVMENNSNSQELNDSLQLETQPTDFLPSFPVDELLDKPQRNEAERLEGLKRRLREGRQPIPDDSESLQELGLRVRERPLPKKPVPEFKPIGNLQASFGYYHTSNVFSSDVDPIEDGLIFSGLRLASVYFPLGSKTFVNGSIDGSLVRYVDQSIYDYNRVKFDLNVYQQLSPRMYGIVGWSNQQLFYANSDRFQAGDRFLGENSLSLSLGRRDSLTPQLTLNSFYEFKINFAEPNTRSRIINSARVSLNYDLQQPLRVGLNYYLNLSDFTQRERHDHYHQMFGNLSYQLSDSSNINLQTGLTLGGSTGRNINFDGWFFSINYNWRLGEF